MSQKNTHQSDELAVLKRIQELLEAIAKAQLSAVVGEQLSDPKHKSLYELTGKATVQQLIKKTKLSAGTISATWQKWETLGLIVKDGKRYKKVLS